MSAVAVAQWHVFAAHDPGTDLYVVMTVGPSLYTAADVPAAGGDFRNVGLAIRDRSYAVPPELTAVRATYRASFDHEPTTTDMDALAPVGHRSWEQDETEDQE